MRFGWKVLVPTALVWIIIVATLRTVSREADLSTGEVALYVGVPVALLVLIGLAVASRTANRDTRLMAEEAAAGGVHANDPEPEVLPPAGPRRRPTGGPSRAEGGFPIPPMDLKVPPSPRLRREPVSTDGSAVTGAVVGTGRRGATSIQEDGNA
jgi:NADH-quinone oxidoreductase subunit H